MLTLHTPPHHHRPPGWVSLALLGAVLLIAAVLWSSTAHAALARSTEGVKTYSESQALTRAAPTLATDGNPLVGAIAMRVTVCAASGQTLSGGGTLRSWYYNATPVWGRNGGLDLTIPAAAAGLRCWSFPDLEILVPVGRELYAADSVTVSSGTLTILTDMRIQ